jgi:exonuclease III
MLNDILLVFPDILCLQENKPGMPGVNPKIKQTDIFYKYYELIDSCTADNDLVNTIYVKKSIFDRIRFITKQNIGANTIDPDAKKRCMTSIKYTFKDGRELNIFNVHLHYDNLNNDISTNFANALKIIEKIPGDKIILGDFNSYCKYDYPDIPISGRNILNDFMSSKSSMPGLDIKNPSHVQSLFSVCESINATKDNSNLQLIDMYESYLGNSRNFFTDTKSFIPLNTNRYGGRIDLMFWNIKNEQKLLGMYKLYSEESDHSPIICDLYDPLPRFDPATEKTMTFKNYVDIF